MFLPEVFSQMMVLEQRMELFQKQQNTWLNLNHMMRHPFQLGMKQVL
jgi:hypothetical protein